MEGRPWKKERVKHAVIDVIPCAMNASSMME